MSSAQWFQAVDVDRSGQISVQELQRALAMGRINLSLKVCAQIIRQSDRDGGGTISYDEFVKLTEFLTQMTNSFQYFDKDRGGTLSIPETKQAVAHAGYHLDDNAFYAAMKAFDPDRDGNLGLPEFIALTLFLKAAATTFAAFDTQRTGRVTLDFGQFVYAAANTQ